jgi:hypothetical protein
MTYDELYAHITHYVAHPHTAITKHDRLRACLILGAFVEFILDCQDEVIHVNIDDVIDFIDEKLNELKENKTGTDDEEVQ